MSRFPPDAQGPLLAFAQNMSNKLTMNPTEYSVTAAQALSLSTKLDLYSLAYQAITEPDSRTHPKIVAKNEAKSALIAEIRMLARIIQASPTVTNQMRADLGLPIRDVAPTPWPVPAQAPLLSIVKVVGRTVHIRLIDVLNPTERGKPQYVEGASVFSFVGAEAPADIADWKFESNTTRTSYAVEFPASVPTGAQVWLTAFWYNGRGESGPACTAVPTNVITGVAQAA